MIKNGNPVQELFSSKKNIIKLIFDFFLIWVAVRAVLLFKYDVQWQNYMHKGYYISYALVYIIAYISYKGKVKSWSDTSSIDVLRLIIINTIALFGEFTYFAMSKVHYSRTVMVMAFILTCVFQLIFRLIFRLIYNYKIVFGKTKDSGNNTIIYGVGDSVTELLREKSESLDFPYDIVGFVDDDKKKQGTYIYETKVLGGFNHLIDIVRKNNINTLIISEDSLYDRKINEIIEEVRYIEKLKIQILPKTDKNNKSKMISKIREVGINDILGKENIEINTIKTKEYLNNKTVLITGGAGSIGKELIKELLKYNCKNIIALDFNENTLSKLKIDLKKISLFNNIILELGDIKDREKMKNIFEKYKPEIVFHLAAYKNEWLVNDSFNEIKKNNFYGTKVVIEESLNMQVEKFLYIRPQSGKIIEKEYKKIIEDTESLLISNEKTKFTEIYIGNLIDSEGSIIQIFEKHMKEDKKIEISNSEWKTYLMTTEEGAKLILEAAIISKGDEKLGIDMGDSIRIIDIAKNIIKILNIDADIEIKEDKNNKIIHDELFYDIKKAKNTENKRIYLLEK